MVKAKNSDTKEATGQRGMVDAFIRSPSLIHCGRVSVSVCERGYANAFPYGRKHVMDIKFRCKILNFFFALVLFF